MYDQAKCSKMLSTVSEASPTIFKRHLTLENKSVYSVTTNGQAKSPEVEDLPLPSGARPEETPAASLVHIDILNELNAKNDIVRNQLDSES